MSKRFAAADVRFRDARVRAQFEAIRLAQQLGTRHLMRHFDAKKGFFNSPVSSRVLESALMLHLLRRTETEVDWQCRLEDYLRTNMEGADPIGSIASKAVMKVPLGIDVWSRVSSFASNAGYGLRRKRALLAMLLVELGAIRFEHAGLTVQDYSVRATARFSRIYAASLRLLHHRYQPCETNSLDDISYLTKAQNVNGSWEQQVLTTLFASLALGPAHVAFDHGLAYLRSVRRHDGGMPFIDNQNMWVSCVAGLTLQSAPLRTPSAVVEQLVRFIVGRQHENGGWSFADGVTQTDTDVSANCALVLVQQNHNSCNDSIQRAANYFRRLQRPDGGYPTYEREGESEVTMTANVLHVLSLAMSRVPCLPDELKRAVDYVASRQREDGSFETSWSRSEVYSIFRVLWALAVYQGTASAMQPQSLMVRALKYLLHTQHIDGGWGQTVTAPSDALSTAYGICSLCLISRLHRVEGEGIDRAVAYLLSQLDEDTGAFCSVPDIVGPRPIPFDTPLLSTIWPLLALNFASRYYSGDLMLTVLLDDQAA